MSVQGLQTWRRRLREGYFRLCFSFLARQLWKRALGARTASFYWPAPRLPCRAPQLAASCSLVIRAEGEGVGHEGPRVLSCPHPGEEKPRAGCPPSQLITAFLLSPGTSSSAREARLEEAGRLRRPACTVQKIPGINTCGAFGFHLSPSPQANQVELSAPAHLGETRWPSTSLNPGVFLRKSSAEGRSTHNPAQKQSGERSLASLLAENQSN